MSHLWVADEAADWLILPLGADAIDLSVSPPRRHRDDGGAPSGSQPPAALLLPTGGASEVRWVVIAGAESSVRISGREVHAGFCVVDDQDEIKVGGLPGVFLSTETPAHVEPAPVAERPLICPRCRQAISAGDAAVQCPGCGVWHHESEEFPCWTYSEKCAACDVHGTDLDAGYAWSPEEL